MSSHLKILVAYQFRFAEHYAASQSWNRSEWRFAADEYALRGLRNVAIIVVQTHRYRPSQRELENRAAIVTGIAALASHQSITIEFVDLP